MDLTTYDERVVEIIIQNSPNKYNVNVQRETREGG